jgi:Tfp pilus assembly protein PilP
MMRLTLAVLGTLFVSLLAYGQAAAPVAKTSPPVPLAAPVDNLPSPPKDFVYAAAGRRDPFQTLARGASTVTTPSAASRPSGAAGLLVDEITVNGIVRSAGAYVAMLSGPAKGQSYTVKAGARLFDGTVQSITPAEVVIVQQVTDPLSLQKQREVRKRLRTQEEGK